MSNCNHTSRRFSLLWYIGTRQTIIIVIECYFFQFTIWSLKNKFWENLDQRRFWLKIFEKEIFLLIVRIVGFILCKAICFHSTTNIIPISYSYFEGIWRNMGTRIRNIKLEVQRKYAHQKKFSSLMGHLWLRRYRSYLQK